jgi:capsular polysaccharide transport system permease protein
MTDADSASTTTSPDASSDTRSEHPDRREPMASPSTGAQSPSVSDATPGRAAPVDLEQLLRLRRRSRRARDRRHLVTAGVMLIPVLIVWLYAMLLAAPRYLSEARFSVRATAPQAGAAAGGQSLLATGNPFAAQAGFVDGWAVSDFIASRECMRLLDQAIGLRRLLSRTGHDPLRALPARDGDDGLYRAYRSAVSVDYNIVEQVDVLKVRAYSPQDSARISQAILQLAQRFVNRMDDKGIADALQVAQRMLARSQAADRGASAALGAWRRRHGSVDPEAEAAMLLSLVGQLEQQRADAQNDLDRVRAYRNAEHPMLAPAEQRLASVERRLAAARQRIGGGANTQAARLVEYGALRNAQMAADADLSATRQAFQQAYADAIRLQRYLTVIADPVPEDRPGSPNLMVFLPAALAVGLVLAFLLSVLQALPAGWVEPRADRRSGDAEA